MRIAARCVSLKPLAHEAPVRCGMVRQDRQVGFGGEVREPLQTARWSDISTQHATLLAALPFRDPNCCRSLSVVVAGFSRAVAS